MTFVSAEPAHSLLFPVRDMNSLLRRNEIPVPAHQGIRVQHAGIAARTVCNERRRGEKSANSLMFSLLPGNSRTSMRRGNAHLSGKANTHNVEQPSGLLV